MVMFQPLGLWFQRPMWCYGRACLLHSHQQRGSDSFAFSTRPLGWSRQRNPHQTYQVYQCMSILGPQKWLNCTELTGNRWTGPSFCGSKSNGHWGATDDPLKVGRNKKCIMAELADRRCLVIKQWIVFLMMPVYRKNRKTLEKRTKSKSILCFREIWMFEINMFTVTHSNPTCSEIFIRFRTFSTVLWCD